MQQNRWQRGSKRLTWGGLVPTHSDSLLVRHLDGGWGLEDTEVGRGALRGSPLSNDGSEGIPMPHFCQVSTAQGRSLPSDLCLASIRSPAPLLHLHVTRQARPVINLFSLLVKHRIFSSMCNLTIDRWHLACYTDGERIWSLETQCGRRRTALVRAFSQTSR